MCTLMKQDYAVRSSFLRMWLSIFRNYDQFVIRPKMFSRNNRDMSVTLTGSYLQAPSIEKGRAMSTSMSDSAPSLEFWDSMTLEKMFDIDRFLKSSPSGSKSFLAALSRTETFYVCFCLLFIDVYFKGISSSVPLIKKKKKHQKRFIEKRTLRDDIDHDVKYFDEKILEKLGRSRFAKAKATPFLESGDYSISHEFEVPPPFVGDLDRSRIEEERKVVLFFFFFFFAQCCNETEKYIYTEWPKLDSNLFYAPRKRFPTGGDTDLLVKNDERQKSLVESHDSDIKTGGNAALNGSENGTDPKARVSGDNLFKLDRIIYHLWFYLFLRTIQRPLPDSGVTLTSAPLTDEKKDTKEPQKSNDETQLQSIYLLIKVINQMINENVGLPDSWVFAEIVDAMGRCGLGHLTLKLCLVRGDKTINKLI
ncbi:hypothetical protein RFI_23138 [Reticulomyxa filosa]|uniref:Uncharacterized protein n=1 Tax=Reticulomyxa filosa TaxID=46433 RepID=X6MKR8_RETFI|nr:hypothetical protein RFI_23138 [Reticulomyxa filosa]|eukprot:ETO14236.1 hypothetical protein RFI_23138 [Reticulomyxa filosa]